MLSCASSADRGLRFTPLSFDGEGRQNVSEEVWFSGHLLCFEHFLICSREFRPTPIVQNGRLMGAVNIFDGKPACYVWLVQF